MMSPKLACEFAASRPWRAACRGLIALLGLSLPVALAPAPGVAAPVRTLAISGAADGSLAFGQDLVRLWSARNSPTPERLALQVRASAHDRLRALGRGRADFAILPADVAAGRLRNVSRAGAVGVLWPVYLHAVTRAAGVQSLRLPATLPVRVAEDALFAYPVLAGLESLPAENGSAQTPPAPPPGAPAGGTAVTLAAGGALTVLDSLPERSIALLTAPAPAVQIQALLEADPRLRLLHFDPALVEELRLRHPWLQVAVLPLGLYPRMQAAVESPARYQVLVASGEVPDDSVRKMLETIWGSPAAAVNPLFAEVDPALNEIFAPLLPFHPVSAKAFGLKSAETAEGNP